MDDFKRWEDFRTEMKNLEDHYAKLARSFLELGAYKDAAECAIKADGISFVCGRMPLKNIW